MRIVHLVISGAVAGGQRVALQLAHAARERGDDLAFAVPGPGPLVDLLEEEGIPAHLVPLRRTFDLLAARGLRRLLDPRTILHTHTLVAGNVLGALAAPGPVVRHLHIENHFRAATEPVLRRLDNATARRCARLIAVSSDTRRAYERQGRTAPSEASSASRTERRCSVRSGVSAT
jgi:hypothetical protein